MMRTNRLACRFLLCVLLLPLCGCSVLTHYTDRVSPVRDVFVQGNPQGALSLLQTRKLNSATDRVCYLLEEGTLKHTAGDFAGSNQIFFDAVSIMQDRDMRAVVSGGKTLEQAGSVLINEKTIAYEGEGFERVFVHTLQALNFLLSNDKGSARVEIKKAYEEADWLEQRNYKKLEAAQDKLQEENAKRQQQNQQLSQTAILDNANSTFSQDPDYAMLQSKALSVLNAYQNAFTYYLSSLVYEMNGDYNDAYIDCKTAHQLRPGVPAVQRDLVRLAALNGFKDDLEQWEKEFGLNYAEMPMDVGDLIVVHQCGTAVEKKQIWVPIPIPEVGIQSFAFAVYRPVPFPAWAVSVVDGSTTLGATDFLADMDALAVRNLNDRIPEIVIRTAVRFAIKALATYQMKKEMGAGGALIGMALTALTEQADLRSWLLMPSNLQIARIPLPPGEHRLGIVLEDSRRQTLDRRDITVTIEKGKMTLVNLRGIQKIVNDVQISSSL